MARIPIERAEILATPVDNGIVSVIIPTYNMADTVSKAMLSCFTQDYPKIEVVVVDDGSTDETRKLVEPNSQVKYIYQDNLGCAGALNTGIKESTGQYIAWLSADDYYIDDQAISKRVAKLEENKLDFVHSWFKNRVNDGLIQEYCPDSFTDMAQAYEAKLFTTDCIKDGKILPVHIQLTPTNKCNLSCSFCSCAERDKGLELPFPVLEKFLWEARDLGTQAVTITGGGEPLMYPDIGNLITCCHNLGIKVGLVTNGFLISNIANLIDKCTWIRISMADDRKLNIFDNLADTVNLFQNGTDWAFSYVASPKPNYPLIEKMVNFANDRKFTHIRIVSDLLDVENTWQSVCKIGAYLASKEIDCSRIIYQKRDDSTPGQRKCLISLLKPLITPSGHIVACCGWQYRGETPSRDLDTAEAMGTIDDFRQIIEGQKYFDGSKCKRCYYSNYNRLLDIMTQDLKHKEFM